MQEIHEAITVLGGGLAGAQAALTIADLGVTVELYEMRPVVQTPAHQTSHAAELVCSNSLRSNQPYSAPWLLKEELRQMNCHLLRFAEQAAIPGGTSLTVDREQFPQLVTAALEAHKNVRLVRKEVVEVPLDRICVVATGPLTSDALAGSIQALTGNGNLFFYDAIAPVVDAETVAMDRVYAASRYGKGGADFLNCPLDREEYLRFREALLSADGVFAHEFDNLDFFGCPPLEKVARQGEDTLRFGPMKPVGLPNPRTGQVPYAVLQLRQENRRRDSYNLVAFQNQLKFNEQQRVFRLIPGLELAEFVRFGQMHRNTYLNAPRLLHPTLNLRSHPHLFFAGQLAGVEGYVESIGTGLLAGMNAYRLAKGMPLMPPAQHTALGSICQYLAHADAEDFAPVRFTFDLLPIPDDLPEAIRRNRVERRSALCRRALAVS